MNRRKTFIDLVAALLPAKPDSLMLASVLEDGKRTSKAISINDIADQLDEELYTILSVGSMAYENASDYALKTHDHDTYTSADYVQTGTGTQLQSFLTLSHNSLNQVLKVNVDKSGDNKIPDIEAVISAAQPKLGEIRQLAKRSYSIPSYDSDQFLGWVPANGQTYTTTDFKLSDDIPKVFSTSGNRFTVPNLNNFCKFDVRLAASSYSTTEGQTHVRNHNHTVAATNATLVIKDVRNIENYDGGNPYYYCNSKTGGGGFMASEFAHNGTGTKYECDCSSYNDIRTDVFNKSGLQTMPMNDPDSPLPATYPSHNYIPTLVYVGPGKNTPPYFRP